VLPALGRERLGDITLPMLQRYVNWLAGEGLAPATISLTVAPLRVIFRRARQLGEVQANPTSAARAGAGNPRRLRGAVRQGTDGCARQRHAPVPRCDPDADVDAFDRWLDSIDLDWRNDVTNWRED
jgi:Phage integrase SAM-like domain